MQLCLWDGLPTEDVRSVLDVDQVNIIIRCHGDDVRLLRVPFDGVKRIYVGRRLNTQHNFAATKRMRRMSIAANERNLDEYVRHIIGDDLGKLPDDDSAVRRDTSQTVAVYGHIAHSDVRREDRRELEQCAIPARARDDTNTTCEQN